MDYGLLPPEINSGRMYTGPGSGSLVAASAGWGELADQLHSAAAGFGSVISTLTTGPWLSPAATTLVMAASPYVWWLQGSAAQSELGAASAAAGGAAPPEWAHASAAAAASAPETAFAMTVPPPVIAANRALLVALLATNFLGQNAPSIAATEAEYFEMWAQDAAAMYAAANSSMAASELTDFEEPPRVADSAGLARQAPAGPAAGAGGRRPDLL